jgi:hypothetical protein
VDVRSPRVEIHIERLVAHGFEQYDARDIGDALRAELADAFSSAITKPVARNVERIDAGIVRALPKGRSGAVAAAAARAIHSAVVPRSRR